MQQQIQKVGDTTSSVLLTSAGTAGFTMQSLTEYVNLFVTFGNAALVLAGLYFMYVKLKATRSRKRRLGDKK